MNAVTKRAAEVSILAETAAAIGARERPKDTPLCGFLAMQGANYSGELMWVGRAVNGWGDAPFKPSELKENAQAFAVRALASVSQPRPDGQPCPMRWVSDHWQSKTAKYRTSRSAFWRTARRVLVKSATSTSARRNGPRR